MLQQLQNRISRPRWVSTALTLYPSLFLVSTALGRASLHATQHACCVRLVIAPDISCAMDCNVTPPMQDRKATTVVSMGSEQDIGRWERLDDVIMGGQSSSTLKATEDGAALFSGDLILEGGGFCGARTKVLSLAELCLSCCCHKKAHSSSCMPIPLAREVLWGLSPIAGQLLYMGWQGSSIRGAHSSVMQCNTRTSGQDMHAWHVSGLSQTTAYMTEHAWSEKALRAGPVCRAWI